jgi:hypothetical protein
MDPLGNLDVERARRQLNMTAGIDLRHTQRDLPVRADIGVLDVEQHLGMMVLAARMRAAGMEGAVLAAHAAKQFGEEIAVIAGARQIAGSKSPPGELETGVPVGRRAEVLAGLVTLAELIVGRTLFRIGEHRIGFVDLLHARFGVGLF